MFQFNQELTNMIFIFIVIFFGLYQFKHKLMFTESGEMKQFGTGKQKTVCPIWMAMLFTSQEADSSTHRLVIPRTPHSQYGQWKGSTP